MISLLQPQREPRRLAENRRAVARYSDAGTSALAFYDGYRVRPFHQFNSGSARLLWSPPTSVPTAQRVSFPHQLTGEGGDVASTTYEV